jgi:signal transduction histidine kinase
MLGEMAAGIAHEVRNPLGSIALYARMLRDDLGDRPTQQGIAERIDRAVSGLNRVVTDVLAFARQTTVTRSLCDAEELLQASVEAAREATPAWQATTVEVRTPPPELPPVLGDPGLLRQALVNLVRNAVEAASGPPPARPPRVTLSARLDATRHTDGTSRPVLALRVHDSGPGFSPDALPRLFTPFFTTRATGTGLGLSIVHRIADAHGGLVLARNDPAPPGGAAVDILLPLENEPARAAP